MEEGRCKETVWDAKSWHKYQCSRKAVKDGYCKQHHPDSVAERQRKAEAAYEEKRKKEPWFIVGELRKKVEQKDAEIAALNKTIARLRLVIRGEAIRPPFDLADDMTTQFAVDLAFKDAEIAALKDRVKELEAANAKYRAALEKIRAKLHSASTMSWALCINEIDRTVQESLKED